MRSGVVIGFLLFFTTIGFSQSRDSFQTTTTPAQATESDSKTLPPALRPQVNAGNFFETTVKQQMDFLQKQNPDIAWPNPDITFQSFLKNESLNYSDSTAVRTKIMDYCKEVSISYEKKVIKKYKLPTNGNYFLQSCDLVNSQLHIGNFSFSPSNIALVNQFVLLQHHTVLRNMIKSPYFSLLQNAGELQTDYENSLFGRIGISQSLSYILTQSALIAFLGIIIFKFYKLLAS